MRGMHAGGGVRVCDAAAAAQHHSLCPVLKKNCLPPPFPPIRRTFGDLAAQVLGELLGRVHRPCVLCREGVGGREVVAG
jgi:hypothetical protein